MIGQVFHLTQSTKKTVEKIVQDDNLDYVHMLFNKNEGLPVHYSNSNVYMTVLKGTLSITLDEQEVVDYSSGTLLKIPYRTKMNVRNLLDDILELIVIKAPAPKHYHSA
ncbi:MAG: cupin domain-containing protein [Chloroflexota bacterium]|nr:cupin domain-containing protein [Chloroflexota bacterium]